MIERPQPATRILTRTSWLAAVWGGGYALYRWYYAAGGEVGILGTPSSIELWRRINAMAGTLLLIAAILPIVSIKAWDNRRVRPVLLGLCWIVAVGCVSHALIGMVQRVASLAGALVISYPFWDTIDRTRADLQALFFNEPWFLIEGLLWAAIAWSGALRESRWRWWWLGSALFGVMVSVTIGLLSAFGVIGKWIVG